MSTSTTIGLSVSTVERTYAEEAAGIHPTVPSQLRVFSPGVAFEADVAIELQRTRRAYDGYGDVSYRVGAILLTRDEAVNLGRAIARALGVHPVAFLDQSDVATIDDALDRAITDAEGWLDTVGDEARLTEGEADHVGRERDFTVIAGELLEKVRAS